MASADFAVIDKTLIPEKAGWNIRFATNQLVLCYTNQSRHAQKRANGLWVGISFGRRSKRFELCPTR